MKSKGTDKYCRYIFHLYVHFQVLSYQTFPLSHQESPRNSVKWNHRVRYLFLIFLHLTNLKEAKKLHNGDGVISNPMSFIEHNFTIHSFIILYLSGQCISSYFIIWNTSYIINYVYIDLIKVYWLMNKSVVIPKINQTGPILFL